jgi:hypothetical protein
VPLLPGPGAQGAPGSRQVGEEPLTESAHLLAEEAAWGDGAHGDPLPADGGEPLVGAVAEGGALVAPAHGGDHTREAALVAEAALLAEAALARRGRGQADREQEQELEEDPLPEPPEGEGPGDDFAAWDSTEDSIVPMLRAAGPLEDEEGDGPLSRYSREDEETWTGAAEADAPPSLAIWQPSWQGTEGTGSVHVDQFPMFGGMMCADVPYDPELEEQPEEDDEAAEADEEETAANRSAADLLVQEQSVWGATGDPDDALS